jgi:hypothetical protein
MNPMTVREAKIMPELRRATPGIAVTARDE